MKKLLASLLIGGALTVILLWLADQPSNGPQLDVLIFIIPAQIITSAITKDRYWGEIIFYILLFLQFTLPTYLLIQFISWARKPRMATKKLLDPLERGD